MRRAERVVLPRTCAAILMGGLLGSSTACSDTDSLDSEPAVEPGEWLPGGETTNTLFFGSNAFIAHAENITPEHESFFFSGNSFFNQAWVQAPASTESRDGLGPLFNARSCDVCHFKDGRGGPPLDSDEEFGALLFRLSIPGEGEHGETLPDPSYGGQLQPLAIAGVEAEGVTTVSFEEIVRVFDDGTEVVLHKPVYAFEDLAYGPMHAEVRISPRVAPAVIGLALLEAIPTERLEELADPDDLDGDGVSGELPWVWDVASNSLQPGRFGWRSEQPSVRQQSAGAFLGDIGVTSVLFPEQNCSDVQEACAEAIDGGTPELSQKLLDRVELYSQLLAVPMRTDHERPEVLAGKAVFSETGCATCHVPRHQTGSDHPLVEVRDQSIWPYTDLLLHDMGVDLADQGAEDELRHRQWRTPPLWGLRFYEVVGGHDRLMHDGRARGVVEAILWHDGEARPSREAFMALDAEARQALVAFVESL